MRHSIDFFRDEVRNGFYVSSAIKQAWASQLDVLAEIDRICRKHNIAYFADWGTLLGAVRHGGFVPWDDDLDICMLRADYDKFMEVADRELPENYCIHDFERKENHWLFLARVVNNKRICFDEKYLEDNYNFPWLSGVDIFVKDSLYTDKGAEKKRCDDILHILATAEPHLETDREKCVELYKKAQERMAEVPASEATEVGQIFPWVLKGGPGEPKEWYEGFTLLPFEDTYIPVPKCYNRVVSARYGDYNAVHKGASAHDYPAFEAQRRAFEKETGAALPRFSFDGSMPARVTPDASNSLKTLAKECVEELFRLFVDASDAIKNGNVDSAQNTFGDMQQLAADLGTMLEQAKGESNEHVMTIVASLEKLCDAVYNCSVSITSDHLHISSILNELNHVSGEINEHLLSRKEALFLPVGPTEWNCLAALFEQEKAAENTDVVIVPLPLMPKDYFGQVKLSDEEIAQAVHLEGYPPELTPYINNFWDYNLELHCPDRIYIQNPYDQENPVLTVPPYFYAQNLQNYTDELVYVPLFPITEFTNDKSPDYIVMDYYVTAPGTFYADKIYVQSENIKEQFVKKLSSFAKAVDRGYWEERIVIPDATSMPASAATPAPKATPSNTGKSAASDTHKKVLYCIASYEYSEHTEDFFSAVQSRLATFKDAENKVDFNIFIYPANRTTNSELLSAIKQISDEHQISINYLDMKKAPELVQSYDAYYGSSTPLVQDFVLAHKPVMIANYDI